MPKILNDERDPVKFALGEKIRWLQDNDPQQLEEMIGQLSEQEAREILYDDEIMLREKQYIRLDEEADTIILLAGRGFGKLMCVETPILTVDRGFVKLGDLESGDFIFDEKGHPTKILATYDNMPEKSYRIYFSDGTSIDCCSEHLWNTWQHRDRKAYLRSSKTKDTNNLPEDWADWKGEDRYGNTTGTGPSVKTTQEIVDTFYHGKRGDRNHSIPVTAPVELPTVHLPVDPYIVGYWIGDGTRGSGSFTCDPKDQRGLVSELYRCGYSVSKSKCDKSVYVPSLVTDLREVSPTLLENKDIPDSYLYGSVNQRMEMLRGMMDSDGHIDPVSGHVEFCSKRKDHADAVLFLARSVGYKPKTYIGRATLNGVDYGEKYRVCWNPNSLMNPFKLERKACLVSDTASQGFRNTHRMLTHFEEIDNKPMRCLSVDSPNNLFLAGESLIPTHNTHAAAATVVRAIEKHGVTSVLYIAPTARTLNKTVAPAIINRYAPDHPNRPSLKQGYLKFPNGQEIQLIPAEAGEDAPRSANVELLVLEEACFYGGNSGIITQAELTCRLPPAKTIVATTPKATKEMVDWVERWEAGDPTIKIINGSTAENKHNLSDKFVKTVYEKYAGTRLEDTELKGVLILENDDALFSMSSIKENEVEPKQFPEFTEYSIGVDIALISKQGGANKAKHSRKPDSTGIVVSAKGVDECIYTLEDHSARLSPEKWAHKISALYDQFSQLGKCKIIMEINSAGIEMIQMAFREIGRQDVGHKVTPTFSTVSKMARAQPFALMQDQGRLKYNAKGKLDNLYKELTTYTGTGKSPDIMDAAVFSWMGINPTKKSYTKSYDLLF